MLLARKDIKIGGSNQNVTSEKSVQDSSSAEEGSVFYDLIDATIASAIVVETNGQQETCETTEPARNNTGHSGNKDIEGVFLRR